MSITYFPFDAVMDSEGNYDRTYTSEQFALYFSKLFSNGVYGADSTGLQATALNGNMYITVAAGAFFINGRFYANDEDENILITAGDVHYGSGGKGRLCKQTLWCVCFGGNTKCKSGCACSYTDGG